MLRVMGTGPGPTTLAAAGAAWAPLSRRPAPTAPVPMPMPPRNPRRETAFLGLGSLVEFTRHLPFRALMLSMVVELKSIYQKGWGGGEGRGCLGWEGTDEPVVEWGGKPESVILTRRRGDAEIAEERRLRFGAVGLPKRTHVCGWGAGSFCGLGRVGAGVRLREHEEGLAIGAEARGLSRQVAGGAPFRRVRLGGVNGFGCFGLGVRDGFVW